MVIWIIHCPYCVGAFNWKIENEKTLKHDIQRNRRLALINPDFQRAHPSFQRGAAKGDFTEVDKYSKDEHILHLKRNIAPTIEGRPHRFNRNVE